ncbi:hypothetical protein B9T38_03005 [Acinetobacter sp. ANC 4218]|uniref:hypothetical protein n=1 Tax=Acinetobacter sp. ANC 4218 TaxID=1977880 RepID=UPI000A32EFB5|nr:hypothetical protein [Acinetobacter sp. ANC 4218]OTG74327.1 hypothetical protein B9T38_03005 [Acinetobacter sp. ANC 4218]
MKKTILALLCLGSIQAVNAEIIKVNGEGTAPIIKKDPNATRNQAFQNAKTDAVIAMIKKINGPQAMQEAQQYLDEIVKQVDSSYLINRGSSTQGNNELLTQVSLEMDDQEFRSILNDLGLAKKNSRTSPIMIVMDEYFGVPKDNSKPVKEFTSYFSDRSYSYDENASYKASESAKASASDSYSSKGRSSAASGYAYGNYYGAGAGGSARSASHNNSGKSSSSSSYNASESAKYSQSERQNDIQSFVKYVEYQTPSTKAERDNQTLNAIAESAVRYDLRLLDSDRFRSQYLNGRSMTIQQLTSDAELNKLVAAARKEKADWFMAGSSYIYDRGRSPVTGQFVCDGAVSFKIYSVDDSTLMGGQTRTESSTGATTGTCRTNVAAKLGELAISQIGPQILGYAKNRSMYGKEITIFVKSISGNVSSRLGDDLYIALDEMDGAENIDIRTQDGKLVEMTMTYKGEKPMSAELAKALRKVNPTLSNAERLQAGNTITLCIGGTQCK